MALSISNENFNSSKDKYISYIESTVPRDFNLLSEEGTARYNLFKSLKEKEEPLDITIIVEENTNIENIKNLAKVINISETSAIINKQNNLQQDLGSPGSSDKDNDLNKIKKQEELLKLISNSNYTMKVKQEEKHRQIQYIYLQKQIEKNKLKFKKESFSFLKKSHECMVFLLGDYYPLKIIGGAVLIPLGFVAVSNIMNPATLASILMNIYNKPYLFNWFLDILTNLGLLTPTELQTLKNLYDKFMVIYNLNPTKFINDPKFLEDLLTKIFNSSLDMNDPKNKEFAPFVNVFQNLWNIIKIKKEGFEGLINAYNAGSFYENEQVTYLLTKMNDLITGYDKIDPQQLPFLNDKIKSILEEMIKIYPKTKTNDIEDMNKIIQYLSQNSINITDNQIKFLTGLYESHQKLLKDEKEKKEKDNYLLSLAKAMIEIRELFSKPYDKDELLKKLINLKNDLYPETTKFIDLIIKIIEFKSDPTVDLTSELSKYVDQKKIQEILDAINKNEPEPFRLLFESFKINNEFGEIPNFFITELKNLVTNTDYLLYDLFFKQDGIFKKISDFCSQNQPLSSNLKIELENAVKNINLINVNPDYKNLMANIKQFIGNNDCNVINTINSDITNLITNNKKPSQRTFNFDMTLITKIKDLIENPMLKSILSSIGLVRYIYGHIRTTEQILLNSPKIDKTIVLKGIATSILNSVGTKQLFNTGSQLIAPYVAEFSKDYMIKPISDIIEHIFINLTPNTDSSHILELLENNDNPLKELSQIIKQEIPKEIKDVLIKFLDTSIPKEEKEKQRQTAIIVLNKIVVNENIYENNPDPDNIITDIQRFLKNLNINEIAGNKILNINEKNYIQSLIQTLINKKDNQISLNAVSILKNKSIDNIIGLLTNILQLKTVYGVPEKRQLTSSNIEDPNIMLYIKNIEIIENLSENNDKKIEELFSLIKTNKEKGFNFPDIQQYVISLLKEKIQPLKIEIKNYEDSTNKTNEELYIILENYYNKMKEIISSNMEENIKKDLLNEMKSYLNNNNIQNERYNDLSKLLENIKNDYRNANLSEGSEFMKNLKKITQEMFENSIYQGLGLSEFNIKNMDFYKIKNILKKIIMINVNNIQPVMITKYLKFIEILSTNTNIEPYIKEDITKLKNLFSSLNVMNNNFEIPLTPLQQNPLQPKPPPVPLQSKGLIITPQLQAEFLNIYNGINQKINNIDKFSTELDELKKTNINDTFQIIKCIDIIHKLLMKTTNIEEYKYLYDKINPFFEAKLLFNTNINKEVKGKLSEIISQAPENYNKDNLNVLCEELNNLNNKDEILFFGGLIKDNQIDEFWSFAISDFFYGQTNKMVTGYFTKIENEANYDKENLKNQLKELEEQQKDKMEELKKELKLIQQYKSEGKTIDQIALLLSKTPKKKEEERYKFFLFKYMNGFFKYFNEYMNNPSIIMNSFAHLTSLYNSIMALFYTNITTNLVKNIKIVTNIILFFKTKEYALQDNVFKMGQEIPKGLEDLVEENKKDTQQNKFAENINLFTKNAFGVYIFKTSLIELVQQYYNTILGGDSGIETYFKMLKSTFIDEIMHDIDIFITDITTYLLMNNNGEFLNKHIRFFMESLMGKFIMHISKLLYNILALPSLKKYLINITPIQKIIPKIDHLFKDEQRFKLTCLFIDSKIHNIIKAVPNLFTENNGDAIKVLWETLSDILNPGKVTTGLYLPLLVEDEEDKGDYMYGYYRNKEIKPREAFKGKFINVYEKGYQPYISNTPIEKEKIYIDDIINGIPQVINGDIMEEEFLKSFFYDASEGYKVKKDGISGYKIKFNDETKQVTIIDEIANQQRSKQQTFVVEYDKLELFKRLKKGVPLTSSLIDDNDKYTLDKDTKGYYNEYNLQNSSYNEIDGEKTAISYLLGAFLKMPYIIGDQNIIPYNLRYREKLNVFLNKITPHNKNINIGMRIFDKYYYDGDPIIKKYFIKKDIKIDSLKNEFKIFLKVFNINIDDRLINDFIDEIHNNDKYCDIDGCEKLIKILNNETNGDPFKLDDPNKIIDNVEKVNYDLIKLEFRDYLGYNINLNNIKPPDTIDSILDDFIQNNKNRFPEKEEKKKYYKELFNKKIINKIKKKIYIDNEEKLPYYYYYYRYKYDKDNTTQKPKNSFENFIRNYKPENPLLENFYIRELLNHEKYYKDYNDDDIIFTKLITPEEFNTMNNYIKKITPEVKPVSIENLIGENNFLKINVKYGEPNENGEYKSNELFINTQIYIDTITILNEYIDNLQNTEYKYNEAEHLKTIIEDIKKRSFDNPLYIVMLSDLESKLKKMIANYEEKKIEVNEVWMDDSKKTTITFDYEAFDFDYKKFYDFISKFINQELLKSCPPKKIFFDRDKNGKKNQEFEKMKNYLTRFSFLENPIDKTKPISGANAETIENEQIDCDNILTQLSNPKLIAEFLDYNSGKSSINKNDYNELLKIYEKINPEIFLNGILNSIPQTIETRSIRNFINKNKKNPEILKILYTKWRNNIIINGSPLIIDDYDYIDLQRQKNEHIEYLNEICRNFGARDISKTDETIATLVPSNTHDNIFSDYIDANELETYKKIRAEIDRQIFFLTALLRKNENISSLIADIQDEIQKGKFQEDIKILLGNYGLTNQSIDFCTTDFFKKIVETMNKYYNEKEILYKKFRKNKLEKDYNNLSDNNEIIDKYLYDCINLFHKELKNIENIKDELSLNDYMSKFTPEKITPQIIPNKNEEITRRDNVPGQLYREVPKEKVNNEQQQQQQQQQHQQQQHQQVMKQQVADKLRENEKIDEAMKLEEKQSQLQAEAQSEMLKLQQQLAFANADDSFSGFLFGNLLNVLQIITSTKTNEYSSDEIIENPLLNKELNNNESIREKCKKLSDKWYMKGKEIQFNTNDSEEKRIINKHCSKKNIVYEINEFFLYKFLVELPRMMRTSGGSDITNPIWLAIKTFLINVIGENYISYTLHSIINEATKEFIKKVDNNELSFYDYFIGTFLYYQNCIVLDIKSNPNNRSLFNIADSSFDTTIIKNIKKIEELFDQTSFKYDKDKNIFGRIDVGNEVTIFDIITKITSKDVAFFTEEDKNNYKNSNVKNIVDCNNLNITLKASFYAFINDPNDAFNIVNKVIACKTIGNTELNVSNLAIALSFDIYGTCIRFIKLLGEILKIFLKNELTKTLTLDALFGSNGKENEDLKTNFFRKNIEIKLNEIKDDNEIDAAIDNIISFLFNIVSINVQFFNNNKKNIDFYIKNIQNIKQDPLILYEKLCNEIINLTVWNGEYINYFTEKHIPIFKQNIKDTIQNHCSPPNYESIFKILFLRDKNEEIIIDNEEPTLDVNIFDSSFNDLLNTEYNYNNQIHKILKKCYADFIKQQKLKKELTDFYKDKPVWMLGMVPFFEGDFKKFQDDFKEFTNVNPIYTKDIDGNKYYMEYNMPQVKVNGIEKNYDVWIPFRTPFYQELYNFMSLEAVVTLQQSPLARQVLVGGETGPNPLYESYHNGHKMDSFEEKFTLHFSKIHLEYWKKTFEIEDINEFKSDYYSYYYYCEELVKKPMNKGEYNYLCNTKGNPLYNLKIKNYGKTFNEILSENSNVKHLLETLLNPFDKNIKGLNIKIKWMKVENDNDSSDWWEYDGKNNYRYISEHERNNFSSNLSNVFKIDVNITPEEIKDENLLIKMKYQE